MKNRHKERYTKPDGTYTTSTKEYVQAWDAVLQPIAKVLQGAVISFDPGANFRVGHKTIHIDHDLLLVLNELLSRVPVDAAEEFRTIAKLLKTGKTLYNGDTCPDVAAEPSHCINCGGKEIQPPAPCSLERPSKGKQLGWPPAYLCIIWKCASCGQDHVFNKKYRNDSEKNFREYTKQFQKLFKPHEKKGPR